MKAAIYARYSTEKQSKDSIEDQFRKCRERAEREGFTVYKYYKDEAVSGTSKDRPEYNAMLEAAKEKQFDVLMIDDLSRLSRDDVEMKQVLRRLTFNKIRIIGVADGYDSSVKGHKIQAGARGLINEIYLDDLKEKTHRGLEGKALNGKVCGGKSYGYDHIPEEDPARKDPYGRPLIVNVHRVINKEEAKVIKKIFEWYAEGRAPRWMANKLNEQRIPSPRNSKWLGSAIHGHAQKGTGILNNQLYIGKIIWNRSEWKKDPDTGKRKRFERPENEWVITEDESLRIISDKLWQQAKQRQAEKLAASRKQQTTHGNKMARSTGASPKYLFSSLLKCGVCGKSYAMKNQHSYGCASYTNGGKHACGNKLLLNRELAEELLLKEIKAELSQKDRIKRIAAKVDKLVHAAKTKNKPNKNKLKAEHTKIEQEIANIMTAIKAGIITESTKTELEKAEAEKASLQAKIAQADNSPLGNKLITYIPKAMAAVQRMIDSFDQITERDTHKVRSQMKHLLGGQITLKPHKTGEYLEAEIKGSFVGLLKFSRALSPEKINMVAGAGFEPTTFGL